jgi:subfamily B ATP-binding cassette protein MsbA
VKLLREALTYVEPPKKEVFRYRDILHFVRYLWPLRRAVAAGTALTLLSSVLAAVNPVSSKWMIDYVFLGKGAQPLLDSLKAHHLGFLTTLVGRALPSLGWLLATLAVTSGLRYLVTNEISLINFRINAEYGYRLKMAVFSRVLRYPLSYFRSTRSGYLLARMNGDTVSLDSVSSGLLQSLVTSGMAILVGSSVLMALSLPLTVFVVLSVPVTVLLSFFSLRLSRSYTVRTREAGLQLSADGQEMFGSIDLIKAHAAEDREIARYDNAYRQNVALSVTNMLFGQAMGTMQMGITRGVRFGVMLFGGLLVLRGKMSVGDFTAFLATYPQLTGAISSILQLPISFQHTAVSASRVKELLDLATEYEHDDPSRVLLVPKVAARGDIAYDQVTFSYGEGVRVLTEVTLSIRAGERIGIVGVTGAGKTTFIHLLLRFFRPQSGRISIDGHDLSDLNPGWIREQVALVSQDLMLFSDTVLRNILYSRPGAREEEVREAARRAGIHDEIMAWPEGYATMVGDRGSKLSGGQKQRIAIARAFLRDAPILVLDEPTAHLDLATERALMAELLGSCQERTTLVITHRESLLELTDRVFEIRDGRMVERGAKKASPQEHLYSMHSWHPNQ